MSSENRKKSDFLIAFRAFFITVVCCLLAFLVVASAVLYRSEKSEQEPPDSVTASSYEASSVLIVYKGGSSINFVAITFNWDELNYSCTKVPDRTAQFEGETDTLSGFLGRKGLTGLMSAYNSFAGTHAVGYLVFSSQTLSKTVNRFGGLDGDDNLRITGTQAVAMAESGNTEPVFSKLAERFFSEYGGLNLKNRFLYLISVAESNLSYAQFHKMQDHLEKMN